jgi:NAD-dependent deacetylase
MKRLVFLTGAGMSAESGISTFRDSGGLWEQYPVQQVASIEGYMADPELVINFYNERRRQLLEVKPCEGHRLVASMEKDYDVTVITQNVDNLHEKAGSTNVIHLHGELMKATSTNNPNDPRCIITLPEDNPDIKMGQKAADGSQLRPFIVWFGESVPMIEPAIAEVMKADIVVVIGTSLNVYPAAGLLGYVSSGCKIYLIDPADVRYDRSLGITHIKKGASEGMRELIAEHIPVAHE